MPLLSGRFAAGLGALVVAIPVAVVLAVAVSGEAAGAGAKRKTPPVTITRLPFTISASGTYVLTGDLVGSAGSDGITVKADNVTIDLRGFRLVGVPGSGSGVVMTSPSGGGALIFCNGIANGVVQDWGGDGINAASGAAGWSFTGIRSEHNGGTGLVVGDSATIADSWLLCDGIYGITAGDRCVVRNCTFGENKAAGAVVGAAATLRDAYFQCNEGDGLKAGARADIRDCVLSENKGNGAVVGDGSTVGSSHFECNEINGLDGGARVIVRNCVFNENKANGAAVGDGSGVGSSSVYCNGIFGLLIGSNCHVEGNSFVGNSLKGAGGSGLRVTGTGNAVLRNTATGQAVGFDVSDLKANSVGPIGSVETSTSPFANITR